MPQVPSLPPTPVAPPAPTALANPMAPAAPAAPTWTALGVPTAPTTPVAPTAPAAPGFVTSAPQQVAAPAYSQDQARLSAQAQTAIQTQAPASYTAQGLNQGPVLQNSVAGIASIAAKVIPAGTSAAVGAATAIAANTSAAMAKSVAGVVASTGEPLLRFSWGLLGNTFEFLGNVISLRFGDAIKSVGKIFSESAFSVGALGKKVAQPVTLTAATAGGKRLGLGGAIGAGVKGGFQALKSSFIWSIPAALINAFIDYKYRDQHDLKRLGTNLVADIGGYTATAMAGAAIGAAVGSMTVPLVGTIVGALAGIGLGLLHDKITRPMVSDALYDAF